MDDTFIQLKTDEKADLSLASTVIELKEIFDELMIEHAFNIKDLTDYDIEIMNRLISLKYNQSNEQLINKPITFKFRGQTYIITLTSDKKLINYIYGDIELFLVIDVNGKQEQFRVPSILYLDKFTLSNLYKIDTKLLSIQIDATEYNRYTIPAMNDLASNLIGAYDLSLNCSYLNLAYKISKNITKNSSGDIVSHINLLQIKYRQNQHIYPTDLELLEEYLLNTKDDVLAEFCYSTLKNDTTECKRILSNCDEKTIKQISKMPIFEIYKKQSG